MKSEQSAKVAEALSGALKVVADALRTKTDDPRNAQFALNAEAHLNSALDEIGLDENDKAAIRQQLEETVRLAFAAKPVTDEHLAASNETLLKYQTEGSARATEVETQVQRRAREKRLADGQETEEDKQRREAEEQKQADEKAQQEGQQPQG